MKIILILSTISILIGLYQITTSEFETVKRAWGKTFLIGGILILIMTTFTISFFNSYPYAYFTN